MVPTQRSGALRKRQVTHHRSSRTTPTKSAVCAGAGHAEAGPRRRDQEPSKVCFVQSLRGLQPHRFCRVLAELSDALQHVHLPGILTASHTRRFVRSKRESERAPAAADCRLLSPPHSRHLSRENRHRESRRERPLTGRGGTARAPTRGRSRLDSFPISVGTAVRGGTERRPIGHAASSVDRSPVDACECGSCRGES